MQKGSVTSILNSLRKEIQMATIRVLPWPKVVAHESHGSVAIEHASLQLYPWSVSGNVIFKSFERSVGGREAVQPYHMMRKECWANGGRELVEQPLCQVEINVLYDQGAVTRLGGVAEFSQKMGDRSSVLDAIGSLLVSKYSSRLAFSDRFHWGRVFRYVSS